MKEAGQRVRHVKVSKSPAKAPPERFPWPRTAPDDPSVQLGVDVKDKVQDIVRIVYKYFRVMDVSMEELLQEVFTAIVHKNGTRSAHDPRKSSFGHYVYMVANNVCINLVHKNKRYGKERDSLDAPIGSGDRILMETVVIEDRRDAGAEHMRDIERAIRKQGMWELARYVRTVRSGASQDVIREVMSWEGRTVSTKMIRDIRMQLRDVADQFVN